FYVRATGDRDILNERVPFIEAPLLEEGVSESYGPATRSSEEASLYQHCLRAITRGTTTGAHSLPLIGTCAWNDAMNRVGVAGRGESTWLGFFLHTVLNDFAAMCDTMRDADRAASLRQEAQRLGSRLELAWDGEWFRRGYYDDGSPLGSSLNDECRIDS